MNSNSLSIFCVSDVRVCVCVGETEPHSHIRATRKFVVIFFFFFCVVESILEFLEFSCCCCFFLSFLLWWWGWRLKVRSRARCGCSLRAWLKVVIASASPVHFVSLFSSFLLLLTHFTFSGFFQSPPFPILFSLPGPFLLVVFHTTRIDIVCVCRWATERSRRTQKRRRERKNVRPCNLTIVLSGFGFFFFFFSSFCYFHLFSPWWILCEETTNSVSTLPKR